MSSTWSSSPAPPSAVAATRPPQALCRRAIARLRIATALMRLRGTPLEVGNERAARQVLAVIDRLTPTSRERLRALVDWVEAYERAEHGTQTSHLDR
jgi:hypothetical protein